MSMETTSINLGRRPATFLQGKESERSANQIALNAILLKLNATIGRCTGAALTHRHMVGGVALMGGMALASGTDTVPQALLTLAAFTVAAVCLNDLKEEGGEA